MEKIKINSILDSSHKTAAVIAFFIIYSTIVLQTIPTGTEGPSNPHPLFAIYFGGQTSLAYYLPYTSGIKHPSHTIYHILRRLNISHIPGTIYHIYYGGPKFAKVFSNTIYHVLQRPNIIYTLFTVHFGGQIFLAPSTI